MTSSPTSAETLPPTPVFEWIAGSDTAGVLLVCEHASAEIPAEYDGLGLAEADRFSHAVWDPGAAGLTRHLARALSAPAILSAVSRAVYDCNRPLSREDATPERSETIDIPGNRDLDTAARAAREQAVYVPFHAEVARQLDAMRGTVALVTVHSFSPVWFGVPRETEIGVLHDADPALAEAMVLAQAQAQGDKGHAVALNQPYSMADGVTHTLARHGTDRGLRAAMIEVRNDLLADDAGVAAVGDQLVAMLTAALPIRRDAA